MEFIPIDLWKLVPKLRRHFYPYLIFFYHCVPFLWIEYIKFKTFYRLIDKFGAYRRIWPHVTWRCSVPSAFVDVKIRFRNFALTSRVKYHTECTSYKHLALSYYLAWRCNICLWYLRGVILFNPLTTKRRLLYLKTQFICAVNTFHLGYKNQ